jgi:hypothetical protein
LSGNKSQESTISNKLESGEVGSLLQHLSTGCGTEDTNLNSERSKSAQLSSSIKLPYSEEEKLQELEFPKSSTKEESSE